MTYAVDRSSMTSVDLFRQQGESDFCVDQIQFVYLDCSCFCMKIVVSVEACILRVEQESQG